MFMILLFCLEGKGRKEEAPSSSVSLCRILPCPMFLIAGLFVTVLLLSVFFASSLRPASRAPLLFRPDTNIQVLLDLKYNLSAEGISCVTCSGELEQLP